MTGKQASPKAKRRVGAALDKDRFSPPSPDWVAVAAERLLALRAPRSGRASVWEDRFHEGFPHYYRWWLEDPTGWVVKVQEDFGTPTPSVRTLRRFMRAELDRLGLGRRKRGKRPSLK